MSEITTVILNEEPEEAVYKRIKDLLKDYRIEINYVTGEITTKNIKEYYEKNDSSINQLNHDSHINHKEPLCLK